MIILAIALLVPIFRSAHCLSTPPQKKSLARRIRKRIAPFTLPHYEDGLGFDCTECGKCCKVSGDVWLAPEEVAGVAALLNVTAKAFREQHVRAVLSPSDASDEDEELEGSWMCLKRKQHDGGCTFLKESGQCAIYEARPIQCETYPFWPSIVKSMETWEDEAVVPDNMPLQSGERYWSADEGGCEGIIAPSASSAGENDADVTIVERQTIVAKMKAARKQWRRFPADEIKESTWFL